MTINPTVLAAAFSALAMLFCGVMVYRNGKRTNENQASQNQLGWMTQAQNEAREARRDAGAASKEAAAATEEAVAARAQLRRLDAQTHELIDWIGRVLARARQVDAAGQDPAVSELLRVINGGPPSMSNDRISVP